MQSFAERIWNLRDCRFNSHGAGGKLEGEELWRKKEAKAVLKYTGMIVPNAVSFIGAI